jgi:para-nitrobenzyl esterase
MATWATFARQGDPNNATVPLWKPFKENDRQTMVLNVESQLAVDPGAQARAVLEDLPPYGYSYSIEAFVKN